MRKRDLWILAAAFAAAIGTAVWIFFSSTLPTGSWGLSFRQEGMPPIGNAGVDQLRQYDAAYIGDTGEKVLYLTFDAGYENGCTAEILDILKEQEVKAAFFLVGNYIERNADLVRRMVQEGHTVGNHTMHHPDMPKFYRPPQGLYSEENLAMAKELGYKTVFWSLAYVDWNNDSQPSREQALSKLLPRTHNGAVILLHSTSRTNAQILGELIEHWKTEGYRFASVEELFAK